MKRVPAGDAAVPAPPRAGGVACKGAAARWRGGGLGHVSRSGRVRERLGAFRMQDDLTFVTLYPCDESDSEETWEWVAVWVGLTRSHAGGRVEGWDGMQYVPPGRTAWSRRGASPTPVRTAFRMPSRRRGEGWGLRMQLNGVSSRQTG